MMSIFSFSSSTQCKYQPPQGVASVGQHIELEIGIYLQRFPPQHRHVRRLVFDYLLKRECCITGCDSMEHVDLLGIGSYTELPGKCTVVPFLELCIRNENFILMNFTWIDLDKNLKITHFNFTLQAAT